MASLYITGIADIDYSSADGRIRSFELNHETLFDEGGGIAVDGWQFKLLDIIKEYELDVDDGRGLHAFVEPFMQKYGAAH